MFISQCHGYSGTVFPGSLSDTLSEFPELAAAIFLDSSDRCIARLIQKVRSAGVLNQQNAEVVGSADDSDNEHHDVEDDSSKTELKLEDSVDGLSCSMQMAVDNAGLLQVMHIPPLP